MFDVNFWWGYLQVQIVLTCLYSLLFYRYFTTRSLDKIVGDVEWLASHLEKFSFYITLRKIFQTVNSGSARKVGNAWIVSFPYRGRTCSVVVPYSHSLVDPFYEHTFHIVHRDEKISLDFLPGAHHPFTPKHLGVDQIVISSRRGDTFMVDREETIISKFTN